MWLYLNNTYSSLLHENGLKWFTDFMAYSGGRVLKQLPSRTITKVELPDGGKVATFFLKRHTGALKPVDTIRTLLSGFSVSWGRKEWEVIDAFRKSGIPTLTPVAAGEKVSLFRQESFLMTEELTGFQSLERFIQEQFSPPLTTEQLLEKRNVISELAEIAKKMHGAGFNHRDFYCCHIFIKRIDPEKREWRVLDLQRVDRRRWFRSHWIIKDLAALNYSADPMIITRSDRLRFLIHYMDGIENVRKNMLLINKIIRKTERISRHDKKLKAGRR